MEAAMDHKSAPAAKKRLAGFQDGKPLLVFGIIETRPAFVREEGERK